MSKNKVIIEIKKNNKTKVICSDTEYRKKKMLDIREYYLDEKDNEYKPSRKGIQITYDMLPEIINPISNFYKSIIQANEEDS